MDIKIFWILIAVVELAMILESAGKDVRLGFHLGCMLAQVIIWFVFIPGFEMEFLKENGWIIILAGGILLWFAIPWLKKEASRGDGGGLTIVEEEM